MYLPWFTRRKGRHKTTILFQTWPQLPNFEVGERVKKAGNQPLPPPLPLSSTELLFLKAENKPPHFKTQRENLISTLSCFPLSVSLLGLMEDFWEMKKCHLPQSQSAGFFFFFFVMIKWREEGSMLLGHMVLTKTLQRGMPFLQPKWAPPCFRSGLSESKEINKPSSQEISATKQWNLTAAPCSSPAVSPIPTKDSRWMGTTLGNLRNGGVSWEWNAWKVWAEIPE